MSKLRGGGGLPPKPDLVQLTKGLSGGFLGILLLSYLSQTTEYPWLMAPFGATCAILFAAPTSPLAQPRNVIGGHLLTTAVGLVALYTLGNSMIVMSLAVGIAIMLMQLFRVVHPPAGANPLVVLLAGQEAVGFDFLLTPVLTGSLALVIIASFINNLGKESCWPLYWYGFTKRKDS
ncbi:HPP family protein [Xenorhabdus bovienii]|uniref:HPP family protein n=1 Tax=Xenorhabdus bovienii TaxID=40576 RepID=UPI00237C54AA|nr:HPP family protein [Xenorhabdus bovienii]MDE1474216.1 HPP family protein [Xenorhabdus bovienii]MDE1480937.1 HPP family protein [Xenorhabdus bovienii]MDE9441405.1 HPP family protein [Xenorhabdus bovienii]MDE9457635.1 HPP family protein [Xenorhabdus bovienii]MDE9486794.1 HPP family protein [Xenorhabdus bovienii]